MCVAEPSGDVLARAYIVLECSATGVSVWILLKFYRIFKEHGNTLRFDCLMVIKKIT